jgi:hypothetical protein
MDDEPDGGHYFERPYVYLADSLRPGTRSTDAQRHVKTRLTALIEHPRTAPELPAWMQEIEPRRRKACLLDTTGPAGRSR